jgi:hypothetical protein
MLEESVRAGAMVLTVVGTGGGATTGWESEFMLVALEVLCMASIGFSWMEILAGRVRKRRAGNEDFTDFLRGGYAGA